MSLPNIQASMYQRLIEYHLSEVPALMGDSEVPKGGNFDTQAFDVQGEGRWALFNLTGDLKLGSCGFLPVEHHHLEEVCSTASLSFPPLLSILLVILSAVSALFDLLLTDTIVERLRRRWKPVKRKQSCSSRKLRKRLWRRKRMWRLLQKVTQVDSLEACLRIAEERVSLMSANMPEHCPQLTTAETDWFKLRLLYIQLIQQCEGEAQQRSHAINLLDNARGTIRYLHVTIWKLTTKYYQEFADLGFELKVFRSGWPLVITALKRRKRVLRVACDRLESYWGASIFAHLRLEPILASRLVDFIMVVTQSVRETVGVYGIRTVVLYLSCSSALELECASIVKVLGSTERNVLFLVPVSTLWFACLILCRNDRAPL